MKVTFFDQPGTANRTFRTTDTVGPLVLLPGTFTSETYDCTDPLDYSTITHHSDMDTWDHAVPEDLMQASAVIATLVYQTRHAQGDAAAPRIAEARIKPEQPQPVPAAVKWRPETEQYSVPLVPPFPKAQRRGASERQSNLSADSGPGSSSSLNYGAADAANRSGTNGRTARYPPGPFPKKSKSPARCNAFSRSHTFNEDEQPYANQRQLR